MPCSRAETSGERLGWGWWARWSSSSRSSSSESPWSLGHDDPTVLELTRRCLEREKGLTVEPTHGDVVAESARGGSLLTVVEGGLVTVSIATSLAEVERLRNRYVAAGDPGRRLDVRGRYVNLWLRDPTRSQRQVTYDCAY